MPRGWKPSRVLESATTEGPEYEQLQSFLRAHRERLGVAHRQDLLGEDRPKPVPRERAAAKPGFRGTRAVGSAIMLLPSGLRLQCLQIRSEEQFLKIRRLFTKFNVHVGKINNCWLTNVL